MGFTQETYFNDPRAALLNYEEYIRLTKDPIAKYEVKKRAANLYYENRFDNDKTAQYYKELLEENPQSLEADFFQFRIGQAYFGNNQFEEAREAYQLLLEKYPQSQYCGKARFQIGNSYYMQARYKIAIDAFKQVLRLHAQSEYALESQFLMAECLENSGSPEEALSIFNGLRGRYSPEKILDDKIQRLTKGPQKKK